MVARERRQKNEYFGGRENGFGDNDGGELPTELLKSGDSLEEKCLTVLSFIDRRLSSQRRNDANKELILHAHAPSISSVSDAVRASHSQLETHSQLVASSLRKSLQAQGYGAAALRDSFEGSAERDGERDGGSGGDVGRELGSTRWGPCHVYSNCKEQ